MQVHKNKMVLVTLLKMREGQTVLLRNLSGTSQCSAARPIPMSKKDAKLHKQMNMPIFDYTKIHLERKRLYVFGASVHGALGLRELLRPRTLRSREQPIKYIHHPVRHKFVYHLDLNDIAAGHGFTLFGVNRKDQNQPLLFGCGLNHFSQLGYQAVRADAPMEQLIAPVGISLPVQAEKPEILAIGAGQGHSIISIKNEGVITLGNNSLGQCGRFINEDETYFGSKFAHRLPNFKLTTENNEVIAIAARFDLSVCLTKEGKVYAFGANQKGQLGRGKNIVKTWDAATPVGGDLAKEKVVKIATNGTCVLAVTENGDLFGWGCNETGLLIPNQHSRIFYEPVPIPVSKKIGKVKDVSIGDLTSHIINEDGNVFTWGQGPTLGLGPSNMNVRQPTLMPPPLFGRNEYSPETQVTSLTAGISSMAAITSQGDLFTWGSNALGNLGHGDLKFQFFPLKVCLNGAVLKVCIGVDHTVILTKGGV